MMVDHKRLYTLLQMIRRLCKPGGYEVERLARLFDVTPRTIYRYFNLFRECGFRLEKTGSRYRLEQKRGTENLLPLLTPEEASLLRHAVLAIHAEHRSKTELVKKLEILADPDLLAELILDASTAEVIRKLIDAIQEKRRVILQDYHSPNSDSTRDRLVEPAGFSVNMRYLHAYEEDQEMTLQFKPERIGNVVLTNDTFSLGQHHQAQAPDLFGMNGKPHCKITVRLNRRAWHLLREEHPEFGYQHAETGNFKNSEGSISVELEVNGFEGAGRFILGLPGEAEPLGPPEFLQYLEDRMKQSTLNRGKKKLEKIG